MGSATQLGRSRGELACLAHLGRGEPWRPVEQRPSTNRAVSLDDLVWKVYELTRRVHQSKPRSAPTGQRGIGPMVAVLGEGSPAMRQAVLSRNAILAAIVL